MNMAPPLNGFIKIERKLAQSERFQSLSANARAVLIDIWSQFNGYNNGSIRYSIGDVQKTLRCARRTAIRVLAELQDTGFLDNVERGGLRHSEQGSFGRKSAWRIAGLKNVGAK